MTPRRITGDNTGNSGHPDRKTYGVTVSGPTRPNHEKMMVRVSQLLKTGPNDREFPFVLPQYHLLLSRPGLTDPDSKKWSGIGTLELTH